MTTKFFAAEDHNRLPQCIELGLSEGQGTDDNNLVLLAELRASPGRISFERYTAEIRIMAGDLSIQIDGGKIKRQSRLGDLRRNTAETKTAEIKHFEEETFELGGSTKASGTVSAKPKAELAAAAAISGSKKVSTHKKSEEVESTTQRRLIARGGNSWTVQEFSGEGFLDGLYLGSEELCVVEATPRIGEVRAKFSVQKKNIGIGEITNNETGNRVRIGPNKQKVLAVIVSKSLGTDGDSIILSDCSLTYQDEKK